MNACLPLAKIKPEAIFIAWFKETSETYKVFFTQNGIDEVRITTVGKFDPTILQHYQPVFLQYYPLPEKELKLVKDWQLAHFPVFSSMD